MQQYIDKIICGDARHELSLLPDAIAQICITSPPYWGLRDYGLDPVMWDGDPECEHEWGDLMSNPKADSREKEQMSAKQGTNVGSYHESNTGSFCHKCGAWLGCLGLEPSPELYVDHVVEIFRAVWRVLRDDGTVWINIGDSYCGSPAGNTDYGPYWKTGGIKNAGDTYRKDVKRDFGTLKPKDLVLIPFRLALALQADGWWIRSDIIWAKSNPMPESVRDRPTTAHEHVFLLAKSKKYYYDQNAIREDFSEKRSWGQIGTITKTTKGGFCNTRFGYDTGGRNKRTVWTIPTAPYPEAHFATFPPKLIEPMILAGSAEGDIVLDPFAGSGTTLAEARRYRRHYIGIEAQPEYIALIEKRIATVEDEVAFDEAQLKLF